MQHGLQMQLCKVLKQKRLYEATRKRKSIMEPHWESKQIQIPENYIGLFLICLKLKKYWPYQHRSCINFISPPCPWFFLRKGNLKYSLLRENLCQSQRFQIQRDLSCVCWEERNWEQKNTNFCVSLAFWRWVCEWYISTWTF